jgi:hypothetical protein
VAKNRLPLCKVNDKGEPSRWTLNNGYTHPVVSFMENVCPMGGTVHKPVNRSLYGFVPRLSVPLNILSSSNKRDVVRSQPVTQCDSIGRDVSEEIPHVHILGVGKGDF